MTGADRKIILQAMSLLENVDEEDHERTLEALIDEYDVPNTGYELLDSIECDEELEDVDLDKKPAAQVRSIKHTHTHATSATSINLEPVITGVGMIGREGSRTISRRRITQEIPGRKIITHRDMSFWTHVPKAIGHRNIFTTDITDSSIVPPSGGGSVPFRAEKSRRRRLCSHLWSKAFWLVTGTYARLVYLEHGFSIIVGYSRQQ